MTMLGSSLHTLTAVTIFLTTCVHSEDIATNQWHITLRSPLNIRQVRDLVGRNGFSVINQVLGSETEYHIVHNGLASHRTRRSISHTKLLKAADNVVRAEQLTGYVREKRGYKPFILSGDNSKFQHTYENNIRPRYMPKSNPQSSACCRRQL
ncbi:amon [Bugula neritina]|uniref:Amon n=1 Tax=Bugula neritina TaxID=10212 RepID=A0A7J7J648_BUGNE|nr:amon [Bugula neritina]